MRSDHPDPAERIALDADDLAFAQLLEQYLTGPATVAAEEQFWARAVNQLGPLAACRLNAAITANQALAAHTQPAT